MFFEQVFIGEIPFLLSSQQLQNIEGKEIQLMTQNLTRKV